MLKIRFILIARWIICRYSSRCFDSLESLDSFFYKSWLYESRQPFPGVRYGDCKIERDRYRRFEVCCLSFRQSGLVARTFFLTMMRYICFTGGWLRNQSMQLAQMEGQVHKGPSVRKKIFAILEKDDVKLAVVSAISPETLFMRYVTQCVFISQLISFEIIRFN